MRLQIFYFLCGLRREYSTCLGVTALSRRAGLSRQTVYRYLDAQGTDLRVYVRLGVGALALCGRGGAPAAAVSGLRDALGRLVLDALV